jgi:redox-sensitive bicupin YhaK (pirin superfamily)
MQKNIIASYGGVNSTVGELLVNRLLPNRYVGAVGPFVFLDHVYPVEYAARPPKAPGGDFAHPHRGIATLSYVLNGGLEHFDSRGHHGIVPAGGMQWMKAGNGIVHDEQLSPDFQREGGTLHSLQFWINLPASAKAEDPEYLNVLPEDVPEVVLPDQAGTVRVLVGHLGDAVSPVKTFSRQFLYHVKLRPKSSLVLPAVEGWEYGAFVPSSEVVTDGQKYGNSELMVFGPEGDELSFCSNSIGGSEFFVFGGEPYTEPIVAQGPFVMNSHKEIQQAYHEFFSGKYGEIKYA